MTRKGTPPTRPPVAAANAAARYRVTRLALIGLTGLVVATILVRTLTADPIAECDFLVLLKREALRCGGKVLAYEGAETRLQCAARRALRVAHSRGFDPPERSDALVRLFAVLDAQVHEGLMTPETATRRLEAFVGSRNCLGVTVPGPLSTR